MLVFAFEPILYDSLFLESILCKMISIISLMFSNKSLDVTV